MSAERTLIASHGKNPIFQSLKTGLNLTGRTIIFTNKVSDLAAFLNHQVRTLDEVLKYLVDQVLVEIEVSSAFVCALNRHNRVDLISYCNIDPILLAAFPTDLTLFDGFPLTDSLRNRKTIWINTLPSWGGDYPSMKEFETEFEHKTFFTMPIERDDKPVAVIGFFALPAIEFSEEVADFLHTLSDLVSLNFFRHSKSLENKVNLRVRTISTSEVTSLATLTERQTLILKMMSDEYTNLMISEILGYSESTIRQESIRIYAKLNCNGRKRAAQLYKAQVTNP